MVSPAVGKVVLIRFPFSDFSKSKLRPAAIVADAGRDDWVLCQITSKPYGDPRAIHIGDDSFEKGSLRVDSFLRPGKLFTANSSLFLGEAGSLKKSSIQEIHKGIMELFLPPGQHTDTSSPTAPEGGTVEGERTLSEEKIDQAVLALLYLGLHEEVRAWKGFEWQTMNRLHEKGYISDPKGKAKSVVFTKDGLEQARRLLFTLFSTD